MAKRTLYKDLRVGKTLSLDGGRIRITLEAKSGQLAKLKIEHEGVLVEDAGDPSATPDQQHRPAGAAQARLGIKVAA